MLVQKPAHDRAQTSAETTRESVHAPTGGLETRTSGDKTLDSVAVEERLLEVLDRLDTVVAQFPVNLAPLAASVSDPDTAENEPIEPRATTVLLSHTPTVVQAAVRERVADAASAVSDIEVEIDDGRVAYNIDGRSQSGRRFQLEVAADGTILDERTELAVSDLPPAVAAALSDSVGDMPVKEAELRTRDGVTYYEIEAENTEEEVKLGIDPSGRILRIESELRSP